MTCRLIRLRPVARASTRTGTATCVVGFLSPVRTRTVKKGEAAAGRRSLTSRFESVCRVAMAWYQNRPAGDVGLDRQPLSAFCAPTGKYISARLALHTAQKAVLALSLGLLGSVACNLHGAGTAYYA